MYYNDEKSSIIPVNFSDYNRSFILSLFNDHPLLPGQLQVTDLVREQEVSQSYENKRLFQLDYHIHHGFTFDEEILIKNALEIVADRLCKTDVLKNMYQICGISGAFFGPGVWSHSQLANNPNYHGIHDLLRFQLLCLQIKGESNQFPTIDIYPIYEKSDTQAQGTIGCISCISHGLTFSINGKFHVKLNRYNLDASNSLVHNSIYWASTIVHELLHNLGHKHPINDYTDQWQINVFEKCFLHNGHYAP